MPDSQPAAHAVPSASLKRIDLHCHSDASNKAAEVLMNAIHCPECYSAPADVYAQATRRGMDFVTITDHDTIDGVTTLNQPNVLVGEELTTWFPEDSCKLHLLVYGIEAADHDRLQRMARNVYDVAEYVERNRIAHAVAHPIYRQNDKLERWHLERLLLLFKGFECLNGAHSPLHREAFEPVLERLTRQEIQKLSEQHALLPRWPEPWFKARTAGSDDHGLLNIGRTFTTFPADARTVDDLLRCLREGACQPGGEAGSSAKLAHTFYSVAVRYYSRHIHPADVEPNAPTKLLQTIVGERPGPKKLDLAAMAVRGKLRQIKKKVMTPFVRPAAPTKEEDGVAILKKLFLASSRSRLGEHPELRAALERGLPPLGEHAEMMRFVAAINRDVSQGLAAAINQSIDDASFTGLFEAISGILAQQFVLSPYYFAVFHQNKERHLLRKITGQATPGDAASLKVGLFTDTFDDVNGVGRFLREMGNRAVSAGRALTVLTSCDAPASQAAFRKNFPPLLSWPMPYYPSLKIALPPVLEILEWADRQQFDAVHVSTPGPMGLVGWLVAKMLRVPMLATYHTDFPAYLDKLTGDHRVTNGATAYLKWFYATQATAVFSRSHEYRFCLNDLGVADSKLRNIPPGVNAETFHPRHRDDRVWADLGVRQPLRLLYVGRISVEKNLPLLAEAFKLLCARRDDVALVLAGDGPYLAEMRRELEGRPAYFLGHRDDAQLGPLYAGADLFTFPSRTDTLGQVVLEAQASGLPAIVSTDGGPKEMIEPNGTGVAIPATDPVRWAAAIDELLDDEPRRQRFARAAAQRAGRLTLDHTFEAFWGEHAAVAGMPAAAPSEVALTV